MGRLSAWLCSRTKHCSMVHRTSAGVLSFTSVQAERGFVNLTGVDYSQTAIDLAQSVAEEKYSISFGVSGILGCFSGCLCM